MEFRILGPLEVEDQGRKLPLGGPAERHLLAVLLCLANEPVSVQRLIDELWGDDAPTSARNVVQQYISHLRRTLDDETRLVTGPAGYVLRAKEGELDWYQFGELVRRARRAGNRSHSAALLREGLGLWRGPALSGAGDGPTLTADRLRLEEARIAAIEDRLDCDLDLGRHCDVTAELESLVAQHPDREHLLGILMLALYRCDRQREALRRYDEYQKRLGEQAGLAPSAALVELERKILMNDPDLALHDRSVEPLTNLPQRLSSFVGRETEIAELARRLDEHRLVTLVGTGGIGKTSLGLRAAGELVDAFPDGIWLLDLAPLSDASLIGGTAAGVLGVSLGPGQEPTAGVARSLRNQVALILLDNCEHLVDGAATFAFSVLAAAPDVSILATSREPLGITGEALMRVPPLSLPEDGEAEASEAVRLFVDRAKLLDSEFSLDSTNTDLVAAICRQLDGIPLAIELAAARMSTMALDRIADGIDHRYELLTRGARTAPRRHHTLRAMMDWSHDVLTEDECIVFRRLGAFAGTFTAAGAHHVCGYEPLLPDDVGLCLDQLVDASLIDPPEHSADRFRMLETIREYAQLQLAANEESDSTMRRLAVFLAEEAPPTTDGYPLSDYAAWYRWMDDERDNYRAALDWTQTAKDSEGATSLAIDFRTYLNASNLSTEAASRVAQALDLLGEGPSHERLLLRWMQIGDHVNFGDPVVAREMASSLYDEAQGAGEFGTMGMARGFEALAAVRAGTMTAALELFAEACEYLVNASDPRANDALSIYAFHLSRTGAYDSARAILQRMRNPVRKDTRTDYRFIAYTANVFGAWVEQYAGNLDRAEQMLDEEKQYVTQFGAGEQFMYHLIRFLIAVARECKPDAESALIEIDHSVDESGSPGMKRDVATVKAMYEIGFRRVDDAIPFLQASLDESIRYTSLADTAEIIFVMGDAAYAGGDYGRATTTYGAALAGYATTGIVLAAWQQTRFDQALAALRHVLGDRFDELWDEGSAMSFDQMVAYAADYIGLDTT